MEKGVIVSQIRAALKMLRAAIEACPDSLWNRESDHNAFWVLAYHALFFAHLYLFPSEKAFEPWEEQIEGCPHMGRQHLGDWTKLQAGDVYTKSDVLAYCTYIEGLVSDRVESIPFDVPADFRWMRRPCTQYELHLYNIRHIQHHAGQLSERLRQTTGSGIDWVKAVR